MKNPKCEYSHLYKPAKKWEVINDGDPDLTPVYFSLPTPPPIEQIEGYGLHPDEQYWKRPKLPKRLKELEKEALNALYQIQKKNAQETIQGYKIYLKFWELLEKDSEIMQEEIDWIRNMWWWRSEGYWCFIDGQPTFFPPDYFDFLSLYYLEEAECFPEFRYDVLRKFLYAWYLESCTETFKDVDNDTGRAKKNADGKYEMIDLGRRVMFGDAEPKTRRTGATHEAIHKLLKATITNISYFSTIISFEGDNAEVHYKKKLLPAFEALPLCFKPIWEGSRRPTTLKLSAPPNVYHVTGLGSSVTFSDSGGVFKNDGDRLNGVLNDEQGKTDQYNIDIFERWHVNKYTMSTGMGINILKGVYVKNPSTVEQQSGSSQYHKLCMMSDFYRRIPVKGQTAEGFARIFLPAYLRLEGFIDRFGKSVVDTPTERQIRLSPHATFAVGRKGAKEMMQSERDALLAENTPMSMEAYRSIRRKSPFTWAECWLGSAGNVGFNLEIVDKRLSEINRMRSFEKPPYRMGYFYREHGRPDGNVLWMDDSDKVKFRMSISLPEQLTNQREGTEVWDGLSNKIVPAWRPLNGQRFTCGIDPFRNLRTSDIKVANKFNTTSSSSRQSDGGIAILWEHDAEVDKSKSKKDWDSFRCVLSYRYRPATQEEYFEDCIMASQYFGAMMYPEQNVEAFISYVYKRGYAGYFLFDIGLDGKQKPLPGRYTGTEVQQEIVREYKDYIEFRGHAECHDDLLNEIKNFKGLEDFTKSDLLVAFGYALLGSKSRYRELLGGQNNDSFDIDGLF